MTYVYAYVRSREAMKHTRGRARHSGCQGIITMPRRDSVPHFQQLMRRSIRDAARRGHRLRVLRPQARRTHVALVKCSRGYARINSDGWCALNEVRRVPARVKRN